MSNYPRDEFDTVEENSARHGVHRASMEPRRRSLMPLMIFGVVALCVGLLAFFIMPQMLDTDAAPLAAGTTSTAPVSAPVSAPASAQAPSAAPTTATVETAKPEPTPEPTPESEVDKSSPVAVFNATGVPGLAARYAGLVTAGGWPVSQWANWAGQPQPASAISYSDT